ncbi:GH11955 [Drosophila grimshawi]|uniref:GH11955 n=1 Tax=Drosophila grimshawi TaxID=7222 RepID=B4JKZ9_DROGR|nr:GH11955 [Drosophila grimshawi]
MTRTNQLQPQLKIQAPHRQLQLQLLLLLFGLLMLPTIAAVPQQQLLLDTTQVTEVAQVEQEATVPSLNDLSDLSAGINLFPVSNLIAAAANAEPPAPVQFVRIAMNSGLPDGIGNWSGMVQKLLQALLVAQCNVAPTTLWPTDYGDMAAINQD